MQSKIAKKYEALNMTKMFKSLFERTYRHRRTRSRIGAGSQQVALSAQLQQNNVCFTWKSRTKQNPNPNESDGGII
jgi:hypothetical protein